MLAFSGRSSITKLDACITQLCVSLVDPAKVDQARLHAVAAVDVGPPPTASAPVAPLPLPSAKAVATPREIEPWVTDAAAPLLEALGGLGVEGRLDLHRSHRA